MINIKNVNDIFDSMKSYYSKIQNKVTDLSVTSIVGGLFWSVASEIENVYSEIEEVKKQAYIVSAEGKYLDRHISGTFDLKRNQETRATGYLVLHANSPIQSPDDLRLWCASYNPKDDELSGAESALKFVTSGNEKDSGRVFVLIEPKGASINIDEETGNRYVNMTEVYAQFMVLPVVSMTKGENVNVPEGAITVMGSSVPGITGVINTYSPISLFFSTPSETPLQDRVSSILSISDTTIDVVNAYNFSGTGLVGFETYDGKPFRGFYQGRYENGGSIVVSEVIKDVQLEYDDSSTKTIKISEDNFVSEIHNFKKVESSGRTIVYTLVDAWFGASRPTRTPAQYEAKVIDTIITKIRSNTPILVKQVETDIDKSLIYDPDNVVNERGVIIESARIGGGTDLEGDDEYRIKLKKYLASLGKSTPTALEAGALTIPGISFSKTLPSYMSPRGASTLLVSGDSGTVNSFQIHQVKKVLEEEWKAAGVSLIVKTPQKLEVTVLCRVSLSPGYSEYMVEPALKYAVKSYVSGKEPGSVVSPDELTTIIRNVPGVRNVWNIYIGRKLGDYMFSQSNKTEETGNTEFGTSISGFKLSTVYTMFKDSIIKNRSLIVEGKRDIKTGLTTETNHYKIYKAAVPLPGEQRRIELLQNFNPQHWQDIGNSSTVMRFQSINNVQDYEKFLGDYLYKLLPKQPMFEITRHLTEPLDIRDRISLPILFESVRVDMLRPFKLETVEVPVIGTFRTDKEVLPLIGIEFIK